ncbi:hypothetical protein WBG78_19320 [Chryseolinea sp. T2]|uniref:hypothetical protein n=1 Tax=Chryseolinea sp. T2 TaxID=3129255 RepID=UPI003076B127
MNSFRAFLATISITVFAGIANGQDTVLQTAYTGRLDSINSKILNQKRLIQVFTPVNYKPGGSEKYDVLYVLDGGNWNTGLVERTQRFIEGEGYMQPTLIVSVMGIDRNRELTPTHLDDWKYSGGGVDFHEDFKLRMSYLTPGTMSSMNPQPIPAALQYRDDSK